MDVDFFKIYLDRLVNGKTEKIEGKVPSNFIDLHEDELSFSPTIEIKGEAYIAEEELVLHLNANSEASLPCAICNERTGFPVSIKNYYEVTPIKEIKENLFDFSSILREALLIEVPSVIECNDGKCPERKNISKYFNQESPSSSNETENSGYQPFKDLDILIKQK